MQVPCTSAAAQRWPRRVSPHWPCIFSRSVVTLALLSWLISHESIIAFTISSLTSLRRLIQVAARHAGPVHARRAVAASRFAALVPPFFQALCRHSLLLLLLLLLFSQTVHDRKKRCASTPALSTTQSLRTMLVRRCSSCMSRARASPRSGGCTVFVVATSHLRRTLTIALSKRYRDSFTASPIYLIIDVSSSPHPSRRSSCRSRSRALSCSDGFAFRRLGHPFFQALCHSGVARRACPVRARRHARRLHSSCRRHFPSPSHSLFHRFI